ncbi:nucleotide-binding universal stress UspA family protein [Streptomyces sp. SAI-117]|uniref:universal stress protein n=1 Tax=Streptomyces sp. SAI-117 TaxID=2940546 RepID=UPI00247331B6|nr:universal stress protein [Streptomyces sp. SAI-117]MDH6566075.1 nucleotide-binding universal stress UspA family protein [Streptomyces sp. SAI-117]
MPLPVIAAVDGSAESLAAAEWAAREAVRRKRSLRLVHAWSWHPRQDGEPATAAQRLMARRALRQAGERIGRACPELRFEEEQVQGPATEALVRAAEQADVLVLGSRGLSGFTGFLVGSVALGVVARAGRPVVLVRADGETAGAGLPAPPERSGRRDVVLGLDLADPCEEVIDFAFEAARCGEGRLRAVHAWQSPAPFSLGPGEIGLIDGPRRADEWRDFMAAVLTPWREKYPGVEVVETLAEGRPAAPLIRAASGADLLVVGRRITPGPVLARTGPVTHVVVHHVGCPVAVVPHE